MSAPGVHGEPSFLDALVLLEDLEDSPKGRKAYHAQQNTHMLVGSEHRGHQSQQADNQKSPPGTTAKIIFRLDDDGVEDANTQKSCKSYDYSCKIHVNGMGGKDGIECLVTHGGRVRHGGWCLHDRVVRRRVGG